MELDERQRAYWRSNLRPPSRVRRGWRDLRRRIFRQRASNTVRRVFGFPLGFYLFAQGRCWCISCDHRDLRARHEPLDRRYRFK